MEYEVEELVVTDDKRRFLNSGKSIVLVKRWGAFPPDHPTTLLCLKLMKKAISSSKVESLLDVGTGTGVLAIAGLKLGVKRAVGVDISRIAVFSAKRNKRLNSVKQFEIKLGSIESVNGTFDLIVANLHLSPLLELASRLKDLLNPNGTLILSGIYEGELGLLEKRLAEFRG